MMSTGRKDAKNSRRGPGPSIESQIDTDRLKANMKVLDGNGKQDHLTLTVDNLDG